jgi:hypothetical protein
MTATACAGSSATGTTCAIRTDPQQLDAALRAALAAPAERSRDGVQRYSWATIADEYRRRSSAKRWRGAAPG